MNLFDKFLSFFGIVRCNLAKPLTLLDKPYLKVLDRIYHKEPYAISEENDDRLIYYLDSDADWTEEFAVILNIRVYNTIRYLATPKYDHVIYAAGKIYNDEDEKFIDNVISVVKDGKTKVRSRKRDEDFDLYWYNERIQIRIEKYYDDFHERWYCDIEYILLNPTPYSIVKVSGNKKAKAHQQRIRRDLIENL